MMIAMRESFGGNAVLIVAVLLCGGAGFLWLSEASASTHAAPPESRTQACREGSQQAGEAARPDASDVEAARELVREYRKTWPDVETPEAVLAGARRHTAALRWLVDHAEEEFDRVIAYWLIAEARPQDWKALTLESLGNSSPKVRRTALSALASVLSDEARLEKLKELMEDSGALERWRVALVLGEFPSPEGRRALAGLLDHPVTWAQFKAAFMLLERGTPEAEEVVREAAESKNALVAGPAMAELAWHRDAPVKLPILHEYLDYELCRLADLPQGEVAQAQKTVERLSRRMIEKLIGLIGERGGRGSLPLLRRAAEHERESIREAARQAIKKIESRRPLASSTGGERVG